MKKLSTKREAFATLSDVRDKETRWKSWNTAKWQRTAACDNKDLCLAHKTKAWMIETMIVRIAADKPTKYSKRSPVLWENRRSNFFQMIPDRCRQVNYIQPATRSVITIFTVLWRMAVKSILQIVQRKIRKMQEMSKILQKWPNDCKFWIFGSSSRPFHAKSRRPCIFLWIDFTTCWSGRHFDWQ